MRKPDRWIDDNGEDELEIVVDRSVSVAVAAQKTEEAIPTCMINEFIVSIPHELKASNAGFVWKNILPKVRPLSSSR